MIYLEQLKYCIPSDLETTGLDPNRHSMISAGISLFNGNEFVIENSLRDNVEIDDYALKVNGENEDNLRLRSPLNGYLTEKDALKLFIEFCGDNEATVIIGKNPRFDFSFLKAIWDRNPDFNFGCKNFPFSYRVIDYGSLAVPLMLLKGIDIPKFGFSSSDVQKFLGMDEEPKPHTALTGARYNKECTLKILEMYQND